MYVESESESVDPSDDTSETENSQDMSETETPVQGSTPTVSCTTCGREWTVTYELDELMAGNRAIEQFALDHHRHTGHFPDDVTPWLVSCDNCPAGEQYIEERPARRFARTHARHTTHTVSLTAPTADIPEQITPGNVSTVDENRVD
jgi:hypothetical protein